MRYIRPLFAVLLVLATVPLCAQDQERPRLLLSAADAETIAAADAMPGLFDAAEQEAHGRTDPWLKELPDIPLPANAGGGYTHEQHKRNSVVIQNAGVLYVISGNRAYADLARDMLLAYAQMYPGLGEHPQKKEQSPGRLFWQSLNEAVWLVTSIQGYDAIYDSLEESERQAIEQGLFRPLAEFLSEGQPDTFDKIHNHGTWAAAAVGMTGYVLDDRDYVEKALYGLKRDGSAGFMRQLDELFSPDGYYSEGPYYQRYALMPFLLFSKSIDRNEPDRKIFDYRDGILPKAISTTIQLSYNGLFFPINDAIKDKGIDTIELVYGVAMAYGLTGDDHLLSVASNQGRTVLTGDGFRLASALANGQAEPYDFQTMALSDGPGGKQGMLAILRSGNETGHQAAVLKATAQGMGHGHFDKLAWLFYDNGREIISDYGAARFLNVESKYGGHYLPENTSWAKQTVAHNTLVVDETSHFGGQWKVGQKHHPQPLLFKAGEMADVAMARMENAYDGVAFSRALVLLKDGTFQHPVVLDVFSVQAGGDHQFDLPLHFQGQVTAVSHALEASTDSMRPLGANNGYQHLWRRAEAVAEAGELFQLTLLQGNRFYTHSALAAAPTQFLFTETGANDPEFNLRREQALVQRVKAAGNQIFVSVLEPHGEYNGSREFTTASASAVAAIERVGDNDQLLVRITARNGAQRTVGFSFLADPGAEHRLLLDGREYAWQGTFHLFED